MDNNQSTGVKKGRPKKSEIAAIKNTKKAVGRPKGHNDRIAEFKARLMGTSGDKIIETVIRKALDSEDKDQIAALKMCMDRLLPMSVFDGKKATGATPQITINIAGINDPVISGEASEVEDVTYTDYEADNDES
jgi:hypothetical protein